MAIVEKLTALADAIRRKTGKTASLTLDQMVKEIDGIQTGGGSGCGGESGASGPVCEVQVTIEPVEFIRRALSISTSISVSGKKYYTHALYNGVRLPRVHESILQQYPYSFIRCNTTSGYYELYCSPVEFYYSVSGQRIEFANSAARLRYRISISDAETATVWSDNGTSTSNVSLSDVITMLWSSCDVPNGSATATDIYFVGSEPILTD